jgi:UDP-glucose 4-epimerase
MKVVVTGGAGFIGANLCRRLTDDAAIDRVVALDDLSSGRRENLDGVGVELIEGSILDADRLDAVCDGADAVVHLAARGSVPRSLADPEQTHDVNATGTLRVLEAARRAGGPHVVLASSSSVYGANPVLPKHEQLVPMPMSPYAASKLAAESYALAYQQCFDLPTLVFRFFNVFGPLQPAQHSYAAVIPAFLDAALDGRPLPVYGDGRQSRDFTFVGTVTDVLVDALHRRVCDAQPVNLAFGTRTDLLTLVVLLEQVLDTSLELAHLAPRAGDVAHSQADSSRLREHFPSIDAVDLERGLRLTAEWMRSVR